MIVRPFNLADLAAVFSVQTACPCAAQWRAEDYSHLAQSPAGIILVAEAGTSPAPRVVGFAAFRRVADEAELHNLSVIPEFRRQGVGRALLRDGIRRLQELGTRRLFLEVRAGNHIALGLYSASGFRSVSIRKSYYHNPEEDACVMALDLAGELR